MSVFDKQSKLTSGTGTMDFTDASIANVKGYIMAASRAATLDAIAGNAALLSIGASDGTDSWNFNCGSLNRASSSDNVYAYHRGHSDRVLSLYPETIGLGDFIAASHDPFQATGIRINKTVGQTGAANLPQLLARIFHGSTQNFKVGIVAEDGVSDQDINVGFAPRAGIFVCLGEGSTFDGTDHENGMISIGMAAWANDGSLSIPEQHNETWDEETDLAASAVDHITGPGYALNSLRGTADLFGTLVPISNGFRVPAGSPCFGYAVWDVPGDGSDVVLNVNNIPAVTGEFGVGFGHDSEHAIFVMTGLDALAPTPGGTVGDAWNQGSTADAQQGTFGLAFVTPASSVCFGWGITLGAATPITKCIVSDRAGGTNYALRLIKGSDLSIGQRASYTAHNPHRIVFNQDIALPVGARCLTLSCGRGHLNAQIRQGEIRKGIIR